jgi:AcrR family transcriptional regulator
MSGRVPSRAERQAQTREALLVAATRVFAARGYHGASVVEIAAEAGRTSGAVYANFESKEQLFLEMIDAQLAGQAEELAELEALDDPAQVRERLRQRVENLFTGHVASSDLSSTGEGTAGLSVAHVQTLTLEFLLYVLRERPELRDQIAGRYRKVEEQLAELFRRWLDAEDATSAIVPADLAKVQSWLVEGLGLRLLQDPELISPARAADLYLTLLTDLPLRPPRDQAG